MIKKIKKVMKTGLIFARDTRGCDVAMRAIWECHEGPRGAFAVRCDVYIRYIYIILRVIVHIIIL